MRNGGKQRWWRRVSCFHGNCVSWWAVVTFFSKLRFGRLCLPTSQDTCLYCFLKDSSVLSVKGLLKDVNNTKWSFLYVTDWYSYFCILMTFTCNLLEKTSHYYELNLTFCPQFNAFIFINLLKDTFCNCLISFPLVWNGHWWDVGQVGLLWASGHNCRGRTGRSWKPQVHSSLPHLKRGLRFVHSNMLFICVCIKL